MHFAKAPSGSNNELFQLNELELREQTSGSESMSGMDTNRSADIGKLIDAANTSGQGSSLKRYDEIESADNITNNDASQGDWVMSIKDKARTRK